MHSLSASGSSEPSRWCYCCRPKRLPPRAALQAGDQWCRTREPNPPAADVSGRRWSLCRMPVEPSHRSPVHRLCLNRTFSPQPSPAQLTSGSLSLTSDANLLATSISSSCLSRHP